MITLVLGGARSGKSDVAMGVAAGLPEPVTFVATGSSTDPDMAARIAAHRSRRPAAWTTLEPSPGSGVVEALLEVRGTVVLDSVGTWIASAADMEVDATALVDALVGRQGDTVVVGEEAGMGVHPTSAAGRRFRDLLGDANRRVAEVADEVLLVVAGRILPLQRPATDA